MSKQTDRQIHPEAPLTYLIRFKGHLPPRWADWFGDVDILRDADGNTLLSCSVVDQAALYGLLKKVRDLGLPLISVNCITTSEAYQIPGKESCL